MPLSDTIPRSHERGHIEANANRAVADSAFLGFRALTSAATLKQN